MRFEVRHLRTGAPSRRSVERDKPAVKPPVRLLPVEFVTSDVAYPHKSVERDHLKRAYERAVAAGADDALFVVGGEVRETAQAFLGFVTAEASRAPAAAGDVSAEHDRTAVADWCRDNGRAVIERPIALGELGDGALIYAQCADRAGGRRSRPGRPAVPLPGWFDAP